MRAYGAAILSVAAAMLMVQPCPAPPAIPAVIVAAGAANTAVAALGTAAEIAVTAAFSGLVAGEVSKHTKRDHVSSSCLNDMYDIGVPPMEEMADGGMMMHGLPASCMDQVDAWNKQSGIGAYNKMWGSVACANKTSIKISDMSPHIQTSLRGMMKPTSNSSKHEKFQCDAEAHKPSSASQNVQTPGASSRAMRF